MNALIDLFESLSGSTLPWALLALAALIAAIFGYLAMRGFGSGNILSMGGSTDMARNRSTNQSEAMHTMSELQMNWKAKRVYKDTLLAGPIMQGSFIGWFAEEKDICDSFSTAKQKLTDDKKKHEDDYPLNDLNYLSIVDETERKPHSVLVRIGLLLLMVVEATGFSLIFADRLSDTGSAQTIQQYAILISLFIALVALLFAEFIGTGVYKQAYARSTHLLAPNQSLQRTVEQVLNIGDDDKDEGQPQSIRKINRSNFVNTAAGEVNKTNTNETDALIPRFQKRFWIYVTCVILFGSTVGMIRISQIEEYYAKEAQTAATIAASENTSLSPSNLVIPPGISESKSEANTAITQEVLDKEKRGKQLAIGVFIMLFFIAQTLAVVLAAAKGFASSHGHEAYKTIKAFRESHGSMSKVQWYDLVASEIATVDRYAQESLTGWQLGMQTAFKRKAIKVPNEAFFEKCASDFSHRTYTAYLQLKEHAVQTSTRNIAAMQHVAPQPPQPTAVVMPVANYTQPTGSLSVPVTHATPSGTSIEYFVTSTAGGEQVERCTLADFQGRILSGQFANLATLNVRLAGQPEPFVPWTEFAKRGIQA